MITTIFIFLASISVSIIGYFMVRTLKRIDRNLDKHSDHLDKHREHMNSQTVIQLQMLMKLGVNDEFYKDLMKDAVKQLKK